MNQIGPNNAQINVIRTGSGKDHQKNKNVIASGNTLLAAKQERKELARLSSFVERQPDGKSESSGTNSKSVGFSTAKGNDISVDEAMKNEFLKKFHESSCDIVDIDAKQEAIRTRVNENCKNIPATVTSATLSTRTVGNAPSLARQGNVRVREVKDSYRMKAEQTEHTKGCRTFKSPDISNGKTGYADFASGGPENSIRATASSGFGAVGGGFKTYNGAFASASTGGVSMMRNEKGEEYSTIYEGSNDADADSRFVIRKKSEFVSTKRSTAGVALTFNERPSINSSATADRVFANSSTNNFSTARGNGIPLNGNNEKRYSTYLEELREEFPDDASSKEMAIFAAKQTNKADMNIVDDALDEDMFVSCSWTPCQTVSPENGYLPNSSNILRKTDPPVVIGKEVLDGEDTLKANPSTEDKPANKNCESKNLTEPRANESLDVVQKSFELLSTQERKDEIVLRAGESVTLTFANQTLRTRRLSLQPYEEDADMKRIANGFVLSDLEPGKEIANSITETRTAVDEIGKRKHAGDDACVKKPRLDQGENQTRRELIFDGCADDEERNGTKQVGSSITEPVTLMEISHDFEEENNKVLHSSEARLDAIMQQDGISSDKKGMKIEILDIASSNASRHTFSSSTVAGRSRSLPVKLRDIVTTAGGMIGQITATAARVYPVLYKQKTADGRSIYRSARCEEKAAADYEQAVKKKVDEMYAEAHENLHTKKGWSTCDEDLDPSQFNDSEREQKEFKHNLESRVRQDLLPRRDVTAVSEVRLTDDLTTAILSIWGVGEDWVFENGELHLTTTDTTRIELSSKMLNSLRLCTLVPDIEPVKFEPEYAEFDTVGVVVSFVSDPFGMKNFGTINIAYPKPEGGGSSYLSIFFWNGASSYGYEGVFAPGTLIACSNLAWRRNNWSIAVGYCSEKTVITSNPHQAHLTKELPNPLFYAQSCVGLVADILAKKPQRPTRGTPTSGAQQRAASPFVNSSSLADKFTPSSVTLQKRLG